MFYNFEEEEKKGLYEYDLWNLLSLSEEELQFAGRVNVLHLDDHDLENNNIWAEFDKLKPKTANLKNITQLKSWQSDFTPEIVQKLAECFPYLQNITILTSTFYAGAIESFKNFKNLRTLKIHCYDPENYFHLQEFSELKQLKNLIIDDIDSRRVNFYSLNFLKQMNLNLLSIDGIITVYNPVINGNFNENILNNKTLLNQEIFFKKLLDFVKPGDVRAIAAAEAFFYRGLIDKGIEYLYIYGAPEDSEQKPPFTISKSSEDRDILLFQWQDKEWLTLEYFEKRPFLGKLYPETEIPLDEFHNTVYGHKYLPKEQMKELINLIGQI